MLTIEDNIPEFYKLFSQVYKARTDVVAKHFSGVNSSGYTPICVNRYISICPKIKNKTFKCSKCEKMQYAPLTEKLFIEHVQGQIILGMYPLLLDHTCWFIVLDFDNHDGMNDPYKDMLQLLEVFKVHGFGYSVCRSKSGKGYHLTVHFKEAVPAKKARTVMQFFLDKAGLGENSSFCSMYPKQDSMNTQKKLVMLSLCLSRDKPCSRSILYCLIQKLNTREHIKTS